MTPRLPSVPAWYRGVWQRTLYAEPAHGPHQMSDIATHVIWLQGAHWHADLRLPAKTPDFTGIDSLERCDRSRLEWLAGLTAFAGLTQIEESTCHWHRFQEICPSFERDVGLLTLTDNATLEERHPAGYYIERWQRLEGALNEAIETDARGHLRWLQLGDHAIAITPRPSTAPACSSFEPIAQATHEALRWRASLRFDYLTRLAGQWRTTLSTHPWHVERLVPAPTSSREFKQ